MMTKNIRAKQQAMTALADVRINPTINVTYQSQGFVLIVSDSIKQAQKISAQLNPKFVVHYLLQNKTKIDITNLTYGSIIKITGYLGSFEVEALVNDKSSFLTANAKGKYFDIIINLTNTLKIAPVPPFGYYPILNYYIDNTVFTEINQLIGFFDKPKFFNLDAPLCVHSRNKIQLCMRCIDVCPAQAIKSGGDSIDVNPNLCHGCGGCSSACPTGAISYAYPTIEHHAKKMHTLISSYFAAKGKQAKLLFYVQNNEDLLPQLDDNVLPLELEELGYLGVETFLYAFCLGIEQVFIHSINETKQTIYILKKQINLTDKILQNLGYQHTVPFINLIENTQKMVLSTTIRLNKTIGLIELFNKRNRIFNIIDFLYHNEQTTKHPVQCDFSITDDFYFGEVIIDKELCTLCMSCTSVCPPKALFSSNLNKPIINFQENMCVQCGLCVKFCPENAMRLNSRLIFDNEQRNNKVTLNQDEPFRCVDCGKVFGSNQIIERMLEKLKNHSMFADGKLNNLKKCEDCRVKALF